MIGEVGLYIIKLSEFYTSKCQIKNHFGWFFLTLLTSFCIDWSHDLSKGQSCHVLLQISDFNQSVGLLLHNLLTEKSLINMKKFFKLTFCFIWNESHNIYKLLLIVFKKKQDKITSELVSIKEHIRRGN